MDWEEGEEHQSMDVDGDARIITGSRQDTLVYSSAGRDAAAVISTDYPPDPAPPETRRFAKTSHVGRIPATCWEGVGPVMPESPVRVNYTPKRAATLMSSIVKNKKSWMMIDSMDSDALSRAILAKYQTRGFPTSTPLRGVKYCHSCGMIWNRDRNAARNIALVFLYAKFNPGKRPFAFQRPKGVAAAAGDAAAGVDAAADVDASASASASASSSASTSASVVGGGGGGGDCMVID